MTNFDVYLADAKTVAIAGHVRPDGDCAGSCLATYNYIKNYFPHVKVDLYLEPIPNIFKFMKRSEEILSEWPDDRKYDLFIAQDCGDAKRLGNAAKYFESAEHTICVDHHVSNHGFADENVILPDASSACEVLCSLMDPEKINKKGGKGAIAGDAVFDEVEPIVEAITPVPGGVGSVTTSVLVGHVVEAAMRKFA